MQNTSGIYQIRSIITDNKYIGSACSLKGRKNEHFKYLSKRCHYNSHLQNHYNKYGGDDLIFEIIEFCPKEKLIEREQYWIDRVSPKFNINKTAGPFMGGERNPMKNPILRDRMKGGGNVSKRPIVRQKLREARLGIYVSEITREKLRKLHKGKPKSEESKKKDSEGKKKWWNSKEGQAQKIKFSKRLKENNPNKNATVIQNKREFAKRQWEDPIWVAKREHTIRSRCILTCPFCGVQGKGSNMTRYHFDKCKNNPNVKNNLTS